MSSKKENKNNPENKRKTNPGITVSAGEITQSDFDQKGFQALQEDYDYMRKGTGVIAGNLKATQLPLLNAKWDIMPGRTTEKADEAARYIEWQWNNLHKGFNYFRRHCLLALPLGCSFFERIIERGVKYNNGISTKTTNIIAFFFSNSK